MTRMTGAARVCRFFSRAHTKCIISAKKLTMTFGTPHADAATDSAARAVACLSRQPILDLKKEMAGYELTLAGGEYSSIEAARLTCAAYTEFGLRSALGRYRTFLPIDAEFLLNDVIELLPAASVVLQLTLNHPPDSTIVKRCRDLRERRYSLALTDYTGLDARSSPLLPLVEFIKIDVRDKDAAQLQALAGPLAHLPLKRLAQGVETSKDFDKGRDGGLQFFQGYFFAHPETLGNGRLTASQSTLIELINLAARDADTARIEERIKRDPALSINLLSIVNSVAYALPQRIASLRQAITLLGRRQLQRWLHLLLLTPAGQSPDAGRTPLLQVAALRGRMMELLVGCVHPNDTALADRAFIIGLISMMPTALGLPMSSIFEQITLEQDIVTALQSHSGVLGKVLALIECYDAEDAVGCDRILTAFVGNGLGRHTLNSCLAESLRWINADTDSNHS